MPKKRWGGTCGVAGWGGSEIFHYILCKTSWVLNLIAVYSKLLKYLPPPIKILSIFPATTLLTMVFKTQSYYFSVMYDNNLPHAL
jgi:apolipoprotein N-acyltransferase